MEFVDGLNLRRLLDTGKLSPEEALAIVPQICDALQYAHDAGVVHRDIKPENILMDSRGRVKIADFGLAKLVGRELKDVTLTGEGQVMGTPHYMAPEQLEHPKDVDHRADIYSLGVVFYQMLTGELPIGKFAPPSKKVEIDVRLDEVVLRALEKEPERRYQQVSQLKTRVETISQTPYERATGSASVSPPDDVQRPDMFPPSTGGASGTPRFSRLAIAGAVWAAFFLVAVGFVFSVHVSMDELHQGAEPPPVPPLQEVLYAIGGLLAFVVFVSGITAPFGTTILGAVSISQIRHSAGRLHGLGLALFDALLFPLLLLDWVIVMLPAAGIWLFLNTKGVPAARGAPPTAWKLGVLVVTVLAILLVLGIDYLIVRWAWRRSTGRSVRACHWLCPCVATVPRSVPVAHLPASAPVAHRAHRSRTPLSRHAGNCMARTCVC